MHPKLFSLLAKLETDKKNFESSLLKERDQLLEYKPSSDAWNMLEVLEHVVITEKMSIRFLATKGLGKSKKAKGKLHIFRSMILSLMLRSPLKFKVPKVKGIYPKGERKKEMLFEEWNDSRRQLSAFLEEFPENKLDNLIFRHPVSGWLTIGETLRFFSDHINHHRQQLSRIRKTALSQYP